MSAVMVAPEHRVVPLAAIAVVERGGPDHTERRRITGEELAQLIESHDVTGDPRLTDPEELVTRLEGLAWSAGSWTGARVAWRAERSHTPVSGDTQIWLASSDAILEPLRPSASRRLGEIFTRPAASAGG